MDRAIAAKWFDYMMPDTDFVFRRFTRNIPRASLSTFDKNSQRSSYLSDDEDKDEEESFRPERFGSLNSNRL